MFGFNKKSTPVVEPVAISVPERSPVSSGLESEQRKDYLKTSAQIGLFTGAQLQMILEENSIEVFPLDKVCDYLDKAYKYEAGKDAKTNWGWRGLRLTDCDSRTWGHTPRHTFLPGPYRKEIPLPVLSTFSKIEALMPGGVRVCGFISDEIEATDVLDPFLAILYRGGRSGELIVVERWNEPGFRL